MLCAGSTLFDNSTNSFSNFVKFFDIAVRDPASFQRLDGASVEHEIPGLVTAQFHQLHAGRRDVYAQQCGLLTIE